MLPLSFERVRKIKHYLRKSRAPSLLKVLETIFLDITNTNLFKAIKQLEKCIEKVFGEFDLIFH